MAYRKVRNMASTMTVIAEQKQVGREITMPKKAATTHSRVQRNKPKVQKSIELVRSERVETTEAKDESSTVLAVDALVDGEAQAQPLRDEGLTKAGGPGQARPLRRDKPSGNEVLTKIEERQNTPAPGSASARLAARRQAAQRLQQRSAATLITSEHFAYVRQDLIKIAIFAVFMFTAIIVLYFMLGRA